MAEQSLLAIEEADVVLFMVDARSGLMPHFCFQPSQTSISYLLLGEDNPVWNLLSKRAFT